MNERGQEEGSKLRKLIARSIKVLSLSAGDDPENDPIERLAKWIARIIGPIIGAIILLYLWTLIRQ